MRISFSIVFISTTSLFVDCGKSNLVEDAIKMQQLSDAHQNLIRSTIDPKAIRLLQDKEYAHRILIDLLWIPISRLLL